MSFEWIAMEHHRLHVVEEWEDSPHKRAALAAIHSTLEGLLRNQPPNANLPVCEICSGRSRPEPLRFPEVFQTEPERSDLAA